MLLLDYTRDIRESNFRLFYAINLGSKTARAFGLASCDSLFCKTSRNWALSFCSCLCTVSFDVSCH
jgi:hypothetical protein